MSASHPRKSYTSPDVKPHFQHLGSDQKIVLDVENPCEEAVKTTGLSDSKV